MKWELSRSSKEECQIGQSCTMQGALRAAPRMDPGHRDVDLRVGGSASEKGLLRSAGRSLMLKPSEAFRDSPAAPAPYPDENPKTAIGAKKPPLAFIPPAALLVMGGAMADGARKYGHANWRNNPVSATVYYDAAMRHLLSWMDGEDFAEDSGVHHLGHVMACCAILIDAMSVGTLNDNRPTTGAASRLIADYTASGHDGLQAALLEGLER